MQQQTQLSKQTQLIDQNFSNEIMLNALAALENLAIFKGYNSNRIFDYYSGYANRNIEKELVNAVILQLEIFRSSHYNYALIYSNYDFPNNLSKEQIIQIIEEWKQFIHPYIQIYYDEMINYLQGYSNNSGISNIINDKRKEWGPITKEGLDRIGKNAPFFNGQMNRQINKVKESYKNGNNEINAHLNKNQNDNEDMKQLNNNDQQLAELRKKFLHYEKKIVSYFEKLIYNGSPSENNFNSLDKDLEKFFGSCVGGVFLDEKYIKGQINKFIEIKSRIPKNKDYTEFLIQTCEKIINVYEQIEPNPNL